jgi:hypothetical protein
MGIPFAVRAYLALGVQRNWKVFTSEKRMGLVSADAAEVILCHLQDNTGFQVVGTTPIHPAGSGASNSQRQAPSL